MCRKYFVRDSDRVRTRIDLVRIDPATLAGVDFKSTALTTRPHYLARVQVPRRDRPGSRTRSLQIIQSVQIVCGVVRRGDGVTPSPRRTMVARRGGGVAPSRERKQLRRDSNPQPPDSKSDTLSIAPRSCVCVEEQGFEPWAFRMQSGRSATELHPLSCFRTQARYHNIKRSSTRPRSAASPPFENLWGRA